MKQLDDINAFAGSSPDLAHTDPYEIVTRVADAMAVLADAMKGNASNLAGVSIAKSIHGTLLLNGPAWDLFGRLLGQQVPGMTVLEPARVSSTPLRFVLLARPLHSPDET